MTVDYRSIDLDESCTVLNKPIMAMTINGIAQGYIADRLVELIKTSGFSSLKVDFGRLGTIRIVGTTQLIDIRNHRINFSTFAA